MRVFIILLLLSGICYAREDFIYKAEFYDTNYTDSTEVEKAKMLISDMERDRAPFRVEKKVITTEIWYVYDADTGRLLFPTKRSALKP